VGSDYQVVSDEIFLKANGFAKLDEVISSKTSGGIMKVTIRASVCNRPLVEKLKELGLTHEWKVGVLVSSAAAEAAITRELMLSGFRVIDEARRKQLLEDEMAARAGDGDPSALKSIGREYDVDIIVAD
jgi:ADP-ribosylglycohydrolase